MPLYSDANYYYTGGSSQLFAPYYPSGVYSVPSVSSAYAPYTSSYNRAINSSYLLPLPSPPRSPSYTTHGISSRYQPKLSTIGETSPLITSVRHSALLPLTRIQSPKIKSYSTTSSTTLHSKYIPPRPININTADIDVSSARVRRHHDDVFRREIRQTERVIQEVNETSKSPAGSKRNSLKEEPAAEPPATEKTDAPEAKQMRSTIRRNRPVVRLSTMRGRNKDSGLLQQQMKMQQNLEDNDVTDNSPVVEEKIGWRQKLADDITLLAPSHTKKSPGTILKERFLIQDTKSENSELERKEDKQIMDDVVVEVDSINHICHVSVPSGPTFHDICEDISSDKIDDDLNAGALRKRVSIIMERENHLLNQLQQSASGSFQLIHLERRGSHDSNADEPQTMNLPNKRQSKSKSKKKIKHTITAIVDVQNVSLTPILQEKEDELVSPVQKTSTNPKTVEEHYIHKVLKLPKKKSVKNLLKTKDVELPTGFLQPIPKMKRASKSGKQKTTASKPEIFTFDQESIQKNEQLTKEAKLYESHNISEDKDNSKENRKSSETQELNTIIADNSLSKAENSEVKKDQIGDNEHKTHNSAEIKGKKPNGDTLKNLQSPDSTTKLLNSKLTKDKFKINTQKVQKPEIKTDQIKKEEEISVATPKPIRKVKKSDSSEDFWTYIGTRETVYMANRKNVLQEKSQQKMEVMAEPSKMSDSLVKHNLQAEKKHFIHKMDIIEETSLPKVEMMKEPSTISENIKKHNLDTKQEIHKKKIVEQTSFPKVEQRIEASSMLQPFSTQLICNQKDEKENTNKLSKLKEPKTTVVPMPLKVKSWKDEIPESSLKVPESDIKRGKSAESNNINSVSCVTQKLLTPSTATASDAILSKKQIGDGAKSPEIKQQNLPKTTLTTLTTTIATNIKTTTTTTTTSTTQTINEDINKCKENKNSINKIEFGTKTTAKIDLQPKTTTKTSTSTTLTTTASSAVIALQQIATTSAVNAGTITKSVSSSTITTTAATATATSTAAPTKVKELCKMKSMAEIENKTPSSTAKAEPKSKTTKESPLKNAAINKAKTSPINADGFITVAPAKPTTSTTTHVGSPTNAKNKNASPKQKGVATTTITPTIATTAATTTTTTIGNALKMTDKLKTINEPQATTTIECVASKTTKATSAIPITDTGATDAAEATKASDKSGVDNNLTKFATVLDLAQCLRDVDADLEDYIPSSAENSNDEDDLTDDSSFYCSSVDGCENLSASMKKKLKQKKRKEKQAQEARFDPHKKVKIDTTNKCYVKEEVPRYPLVATPRPLWKREKIVYPEESSEDSDSDESGSTEDTEDSEECSSNSEEEYDNSPTSANTTTGSSLVSTDNSAIIRMSTCSNDSGFEGGTAPSSPKKMLGECE